MDRRKVFIGAVTLVLMTAVAWMLGFFGGTDPAVAELQTMRDQMFGGRDLPDAQRQELRDQFRQRLESLSEAQRRALFSAGREQWKQRAEQRMDQFFAMAPADQQKQLDTMINRMLERRNERNQSSGNGREARGDRGRGRNMGEAQRDAWAKRRLDRSTPKQRAQRDELRRRFRERLEQRGIPSDSLRGRRGMA